MIDEYLLFVGIDWATEEHTICILDRDQKIVEERAIKHSRGFDHAVQGGRQSGIVGCQRMASASLVANSARGQGCRLQLFHSLGQGDSRQATGAAHS